MQAALQSLRAPLDNAGAPPQRGGVQWHSEGETSGAWSEIGRDELSVRDSLDDFTPVAVTY